MDGQISAYQIDDGSWIGTFHWNGQSCETDLTHPTRAAAEADAASMLEYLKSRRPPK
jgi:hypothetical protein